MNFTMFLSLIGEQLQVYSAASPVSTSDLQRAFDQLGGLSKSAFKEMLCSGPDGFTEEEATWIVQEAPGDEEGIDYGEFVKELKSPL